MLKTIGKGALIGALLTAPLMGLMYLANQLAGLPFVPFDVFNWMSGVLPGPMITFGIDLMINMLLRVGLNVASTAKTAEQLMALSMFFGMGIVTGIIFYLIFKALKLRGSWLNGLVCGALFGLPLITISLGAEQSSNQPLIGLIWLLALFLAWGMLFAFAYRRLEGLVAVKDEGDAESEPHAAETLSRRQFLITLGASSATITVLGAGLGVLLASREDTGPDGSLAHESTSTQGQIFPNANDPVVPVPGTRPEYTPIKDHYKVFIELEPTVIDGSTWRLPVTGLVANPLMLTLDDLRNNYPARDQYVTISCISGRVGTTLISTTQWTGASVQAVLADAGVRPEARYLHIGSGDGFYETIPLDLINSDERIMFCYSWDGNTLPVDHGFPLRIWIPDRFGMKQPKWITEVLVTDEYSEGFWVERGWDEIAQIKATSVIDTVAVDMIIEDGEQRRVPVGGIAWAGDRGISKVEVRVDGGSWQEAQLRAPLSETTWVIWRFEWPFEAGEHLFEVRCAEGNGTPQIEQVEDAHPSGATGIDSRTANL